jgi:hypothetical protein
LVTELSDYLIIRGVVPKNLAPHGLSTPTRRDRGVPLSRVPPTLPRVVDPGRRRRLLAALRTHRDWAMQAMLLGGLADRAGLPRDSQPMHLRQDQDVNSAPTQHVRSDISQLVRRQATPGLIGGRPIVTRRPT